MKNIMGFLIILELLAATSRFAWYYFKVYPTLSGNDWQAATIRHAAILDKEKDHYDALFAINLDGLTYLWYITQPNFDISRLNRDYKRNGFQFKNFGNVYFDTTVNKPYSGHLFFLGEDKEIMSFLEENEASEAAIIYDYEEYGKHYLGVAVNWRDGQTSP